MGNCLEICFPPAPPPKKYTRIVSDEHKIQEYISKSDLKNLKGKKRENAIIDRILHTDDNESLENPWYTMVGGPPAAGKSYTRNNYFKKAFKFELVHCSKCNVDFIRPMLEEYDKMMIRVNDPDDDFKYVDLLAKVNDKVNRIIDKIIDRSLKLNKNITTERTLGVDTFMKQMKSIKKKNKKYKIALLYVFPKSEEQLRRQLENRNAIQARQVDIEFAVDRYKGALDLFNAYMNLSDLVISCENPGIGKDPKEWVFKLYKDGHLAKKMNGEEFLETFENKDMQYAYEYLK